MPNEPKANETSTKKTSQAELKRRAEMKPEDFKALKTVLVTITKEKTRSEREYFTFKAQLDPNYRNSTVTTGRDTQLDAQDFDLIVLENKIGDPEEVDTVVLNCPVRFLQGVSKDGHEYKRVEFFLSKTVYRSLFISHKLITLLNYKGSNIEFVDDFVKFEAQEVVYDVEA